MVGGKTLAMVVITLSSKDKDSSSCLIEVLPTVLELDARYQYEIGLINLWTYNSVPNIIKNVNSSFKYGDSLIDLDTGSYEIDRIINEIKRKLNVDSSNLIIQGNNTTMLCELKADKDVDLTMNTSLADILGFDREILAANKWHYSKRLVSITNITSFQVTCNIACGSYRNGQEVHTIFEFLPKVAPGFLINESPSPIIYFPLNTHRIQSIVIQVVDQNGKLVDFRGDSITIRVHIRKKE